MKSSFQRSLLCVGALSLTTALAAGCASDRTREARSPGRSETFESQAPTSAEGRQQRTVLAPDYHAMHDDPMGMHGRPRAGIETALPGQPQTDILPNPQPSDNQGEIRMNHGPARPGEVEMPMATGENAVRQNQTAQGQAMLGQSGGLPADAMSEQQLCKQLTEANRLQVQNIDNGVRIVIAPKTGTELTAIRETVQRIESRMAPMSTTSQRGEASTQCKLFDVGQLGARASMQERPNQVHLILTTTDTTNVGKLRQEARSFVSTGHTIHKAQPKQTK
ncbi:hypothetical protein [Chondromyces crocatus]|uniref:Uncharacterized protein n=1 Tax=Chondromyces crocatus TaxID=52 RepID=A0A0K1E8P8_CHOCO|nr:hypothetical protein [Chondromyces crocatus]AKT37235.1 uncharacterized protein CMC5_013660 [Chondromyces crocatus]